MLEIAHKLTDGLASAYNTNGHRYWFISWVQTGSPGQARREARCRRHRASAATHPAGRFAPPRGRAILAAGVVARRVKCPALLRGLAPSRSAKITSVKWVNIYDRWYKSPILFTHAVEHEWRAAQVAAQDRAHLATIGDRPSRRCHPCRSNEANGRQTARG